MQINYILKWISFLLFINLTISEMNVFEEIKLIETSKEIIKAIENCERNKPGGADEDSYGVYSVDDEAIDIKTERDVRCGKTTFADITKVKKDNIQVPDVLREALQISEKSLKKYGSFYAIAVYIEDEMNRLSKGDWVVFVTNITSNERPLERRISEYIDLSIAHIRIRMFDISPKPTMNLNIEKPDIPLAPTNLGPSTTPAPHTEYSETKLIKKIINSPVFGIGQRKNLIHLSAGADFLPFVRYLVEEESVDPDLKDNDGKTPAMYAALNNSIDVLKWLIEEQEINSYAKDDLGNTLVHMAASQGAIDALRYLISNEELDTDARNNLGESALHSTASTGSLITLKFLVETGEADVNAKSSNGTTPIMMAASKNRSEMVTYLLEKGATPAHARNKKNDELNSKGESLKFDDKPTDFKSSLNQALENGNFTAFKRIIESKGTKLDQRFVNGQSLLHLAVRNKRLPFIEYLADKKGIDLNAKDDNGSTALHYSAWYGCLECMKLLIKKGSNINARNVNGATILHFAIMEKKVDIMSYLIEKKGFDPNAGNNFDYKPIHFGAKYDCLACVKYLVETSKVDIDSKSNYSYTPIREAVYYQNLDIVKYLVEKGANLRLKDNKNLSPLRIAQTQNSQELVKYLRQNRRRTSK